MKKITLVIMALMVGSAMYAQSTSFESSEGFVLGNLNGQNGWTVFGASPNIPIVTDSQSSDGGFSIQLLGSNGQGNAGGFSPTFVSSLDVVISMDMLLTSTTGELSDTDFATQSPSQALLTSRIKFSFDDTVQVLDDPGTGTIGFVDTGATVIRDAWFELKIAHRFSTGDILYYIDNNLIYTGTVFGGTNVEQYIPLFDNFESDAFFDNIVYSDGTVLGVNDFNTNVFSHSYNKDSDVLTIKSSDVAFSNVQLYNLLGQEVLNKNLSQTTETLSLEGLQDGIYMAKVMIEDKVETLKFLKQ